MTVFREAAIDDDESVFRNALVGQLIGSNAIGVTRGRSLGWGPVLVYAGDRLALTLVPYQTLGSVALAHLVYDALLELARSAVGGVSGSPRVPPASGRYSPRCSRAAPAVPRWSR
ncbi:hypothetical protein HT576_21320 [Haloterrigena sp. SYSU A121-1]|uniref:Uncharacterized protein n=1 Tax=Haloterrigena gelatinilytica TaxID=2741724 RepID=A0A8J8GNR9_9EURY|nr:hypothetical protein [Haloterrigena gelatinilytica]NUB93533.1 hypothetical protein [Haloterrigena gelatinilytica]